MENVLVKGHKIKVGGYWYINEDWVLKEIEKFEEKVLDLDWLHRVFVNKIEQDPDLLLSQDNLKDIIEKELKQKIQGKEEKN